MNESFNSLLNGLELHVVDVVLADGTEGDTVGQIHGQSVLLTLGMVLDKENGERKMRGVVGQRRAKERRCRKYKARTFLSQQYFQHPLPLHDRISHLDMPGAVAAKKDAVEAGMNPGLGGIADVAVSVHRLPLPSARRFTQHEMRQDDLVRQRA